MKKSNILVAVFAVLAAASVAKAEEMRIDFDGANKGFKPQSMHDIFAAGHNLPVTGNAEEALSVPAPEQADAAAYEKLQETFANGMIKGAAEYSAERGVPDLKADFQNLLAYGSLKEKLAFVYNKSGVYSFPLRITALRNVSAAGAGMKSFDMPNKSQTCFASHNEQVCHRRQVCRYVCSGAFGGLGALGGGVLAGIGLGVGSQVCQDVCEEVDDCTTVTVCDQWVTDPGTGDLTDSHGNYRGRGVEFAVN